MSVSDAPPATLAPPVAPSELVSLLHDFRRRFTTLADGYDGSTAGAAELEQLMADYSRLVTDPSQVQAFAAAEREQPPVFRNLAADLRSQSARCAAVAEKHRALRLVEGRADSVGYFDNIESCIEEEFGACRLTPDSKVLLVGSGSFPMTPLHLARRTGATVVGIDIDRESVDLGRRVVELLGPGLDITLEPTPVDALPFVAEATHVIFSSTVSVKYDLLHQLHPLTRDDVVVAMRFGDGLKSLFNYPMQDVDPSRWQLVETVLRPDHVFDVALYAKAPNPAGTTEDRR